MRDQPPIPEARRSVEERERNLPGALAAGFVVFIGMIVMAAGINSMVGSQVIRDYYGMGYSFWDTNRLEIGIFVTLIGTIMVALSAYFMIVSLARKSP
jgi:nitric oxide reductase large subunit